MKSKVDYHIHTTYSDGILEPEEVVDLFKEKEYDVIAITDHDTMSGFIPAFERAQEIDLRILPGIEFSTHFGGENPLDLHILGYNIDIYNDELISIVDKMQERKKIRSKKIIETIKAFGYDISSEVIFKNSPHGYVGKPNIAQELVNRGYAQSIDDVFNSKDFFEHPNIKNIEEIKISTEEAIVIINKSGGTAVLAHPGKIKALNEKGTKDYYREMDIIIKRLKKLGLGGVECYHKSHNSRDEEEFIAIAERQRLHVTRGSDFHGLDKSDFEII